VLHEGVTLLIRIMEATWCSCHVFLLLFGLCCWGSGLWAQQWEADGLHVLRCGVLLSLSFFMA
jgi:hypothetical protein